jgi:transposase
MPAIQGGKAQNDRLDAQKIAVLLRGGMVPQAYVYPAALRATRDLLRQRRHLMRKRAEVLTPIPNTTSQYHLPEIGKQIASKAHRDGVAERCADPAVQKSLEVDLALIAPDDRLLRDRDLTLLKTVKPHDVNTLYLLRTVPGIGEILRLVWLYAIPDIDRFPRGQDFVSSCRLVKGAKASAGKRYGPSGTKIGKASLTWAFSEAAVLFLRNNPQGQQYLTRLEKKQGTGQALPVLAHTLARAVYYMFQRKTACNMQHFLQR